MHKSATRSFAFLGLVVSAAIALTGCASAAPTGVSAPAAASGAVDLSSVCPSTVTIQTDWNPEADHGHLYELLGPDPVINADKKSVSGNLFSGGKSTGIKVEIRSGGPAIGFSSVSAELYKEKTITLGYVSTDEAVQLSASLPTTAVFAENDISPQMVMWDPSRYPTVKTISELAVALKASGGVVRYFQGATYMSYLQASGILPATQTDGAYDGSPAKFVTAKGKDAQQGFATAEPFVYQNEVAAWGKPLSYQLVHDTGYPIYPEAVSVRNADLTKLSPCLTKLVPVLQQADVDYINKPTTTNVLLVKLVNAYNNGWVYSAKVADFGVAQMKKLKIASNGDNGYVGDMDEKRIARVLEIDTPLFTGTGSAPKSGLKATDLFTNKFLSTTIGF